MRYFLITFIVLAAAATAFSQDWGSVEALGRGKSVYVTQRSGPEIKGKITSVSPTSLDIIADGRSLSIAKDDVLTVHLSKRGSVLKRALIGAAAGAGIGVAIGVGVTAATKGDGLAAAGGFLYGIPIGAAVGAATAGKKRGRLIYASQ